MEKRKKSEVRHIVFLMEESYFVLRKIEILETKVCMYVCIYLPIIYQHWDELNSCLYDLKFIIVALLLPGASATIWAAMGQEMAKALGAS